MVAVAMAVSIENDLSCDSPECSVGALRPSRMGPSQKRRSDLPRPCDPVAQIVILNSSPTDCRLYSLHPLHEVAGNSCSPDEDLKKLS